MRRGMGLYGGDDARAIANKRGRRFRREFRPLTGFRLLLRRTSRLKAAREAAFRFRWSPLVWNTARSAATNR
jgi:hypothetical protein